MLKFIYETFRFRQIYDFPANEKQKVDEENIIESTANIWFVFFFSRFTMNEESTEIHYAADRPLVISCAMLTHGLRVHSQFRLFNAYCDNIFYYTRRTN